MKGEVCEAEVMAKEVRRRKYTFGVIFRVLVSA
jgi:hypothetical protein